ncbi:MAG: putative aminohydrolase SsnA [Firmicutes bacterium]|nr:putative aminohydrolase SsnA [Bacillota bacterium]
MLRIENGRVLTRDPEHPWFDDGAVAIDGESIVCVGRRQDVAAAYPQAEVLDAGGGLIMPALINLHHHIYSALSRGLTIRGYAPKGFGDILEGLWWRLDGCLNNEDNRASALVTAVDCIKNGVTTVFDHHASYGQTEDSLFVLAEALRGAGLRCCLCYETSDRHGPAQAARAIRENAAFIRHCRRQNDPGLQGMMGLHASFTLSPATLEQAVTAAEGAGLHIHVAEGPVDEEDCLAKYGCRVVRRLADCGALSPKTIAVHGVFLDEEEIDLLREHQVIVAHNPESNMGNAVGCPPVMRMMARGVLCGLGTDGYTGDMLESYKAANLIHKLALADCNAAWQEAPQMLFVNNPQIAACFFAPPLGVLRPGAAADVIVLDYHPITPMDAANADAHLLFGVNGRSVQSTVAAGRILMKNRQLTALDEEQIAGQARQQAASLWARINA